MWDLIWDIAARPHVPAQVSVISICQTGAVWFRVVWCGYWPATCSGTKWLCTVAQSDPLAWSAGFHAQQHIDAGVLMGLLPVPRISNSYSQVDTVLPSNDSRECMCDAEV